MIPVIKHDGRSLQSTLNDITMACVTCNNQSTSSTATPWRPVHLQPLIELWLLHQHLRQDVEVSRPERTRSLVAERGRAGNLRRNTWATVFPIGATGNLLVLLLIFSRTLLKLDLRQRAIKNQTCLQFLTMVDSQSPMQKEKVNKSK